MSAPAAPVFSVLVANYNHGRLVTRAVDSVLSQEFPVADREVIVVDDGSSDDSRQRLAAYRGTPGVHVVLQDNRGQTAAFAAALLHARGEYVCLLDADDRCLPGKLQALASHLSMLGASPEKLFLCHDLEIVDGADGLPIADRWFDIIGQRRFGAHLHVAAAHHFFPFSVSSGMVFGRSLLNRVMAEVPLWEWPMGSDGVLGQAAMMMAGEVHYLPQVLGSYVVHGGNNFASIQNGAFVQKPVWHGRWPKKLRFLELLVDSLPLSERERDDRVAYLARIEHAVRVVPLQGQYTNPLLSFVVDACAADVAGPAAQTHAALARLTRSHHEVVWVCHEDTVLPESAGSLRATVPHGADTFERLRVGLETARGAYVNFLDAGDRPDPRFTERHLHAHRYGSLPMLTLSDLRLIDGNGAFVHLGIQSTAAGWSTAPTHVPAFGGLLRDWALAPLPAIVFRRTPLMDAFFRAAPWPMHARHAGWLLSQYMLQLGGATRLLENLVDLRLPGTATPNASWLSQFIDRHGPLPAPDLAVAAEALFAAYARTPDRERAYFSHGWEARFVRWLVQSGGGAVPGRLERQLLEAGDTPWTRRVAAVLRTAAGRA